MYTSMDTMYDIVLKYFRPSLMYAGSRFALPKPRRFPWISCRRGTSFTGRSERGRGIVRVLGAPNAR